MAGDKRRELRLEFRGCTVRVAGVPGEPLDVVDLSIDGLQFHSPAPFAAGAPIRLEIHTPHFAAPIAIEARVAWCLPSGGGPGHRVGVEFLPLPRKETDRLGELKDEGIHRQMNPRIL